MSKVNKCPDCGASNPPDAVICGLCGKTFVAKPQKKSFSNFDFDTIPFSSTAPQPAEPTVDYKNTVPLNNESDYTRQEPEQQKPPLYKILMLPAFIVLIVLYGIYYIIDSMPIRSKNGVILAPDEPFQRSLNREDQKVITFKEDIITFLAEFKITSRVLSRERYYFGPESKYSPVDLAMGWGLMSEQQVLDKIDISQSGRFYYWSTSQFPIPRRTIEQKSANMHIIPAGDKQYDTLLDIKAGNLVRIKGYLCEVIGNNWSWRSSLTRNDTGDGACEIIYAEEIEIIK